MKNENAVVRGISDFLRTKPIWVSWIFHIAVTGALFGIFHLVLYLLGIQLWFGILILILLGFGWGTIVYLRIKG
ncbi:MAG: hypothetical protein JW904_03580 [Spirochaetales bacterium]|nr:hypothetical protein [Spirochaetales bacterium]